MISPLCPNHHHHPQRPSLQRHRTVFSSWSYLMLKVWPQSPAQDLVTPRASAHDREKNPFDELVSYPTTPTAVHPLLAVGGQLSPFQFSPSSAYGGSVTSDLTPSPAFASAKPTIHLSLHAPVFNMNQPPRPKSQKSSPSSSSSRTSTSTGSQASQPTAGSSRGQIHVKLIQARGLNVQSMHAKPYVVVQFEHGEFVSRDPIPETDKEVKGTAVNLSSSNAINALNGIGSKSAVKQDSSRKNSKGSKDSSPTSSLLSSFAKSLTGASGPSSQHIDTTPPSPSSITTTNGLFSRMQAHNPVWKHEVSLYVLGCAPFSYNFFY